MKKVFVLLASCLFITLLAGIKSAQGQAFPPQPGEDGGNPPSQEQSECDLPMVAIDISINDDGVTIQLSDAQTYDFLSPCRPIAADLYRISKLDTRPNGATVALVGSTGVIGPDQAFGAVVEDNDLPPGEHYYRAYIFIGNGDNIYEFASEEFTVEANICDVACCRLRDSTTLVELYNSTNGVDWHTTWDLAQPIDTWHGVTLNAEGCVESIVMGTNNLIGTLPPSVGDLSELKILGLGGNEMGDTIPAQIANLRQLTNIGLGNNNFIGGIPPQIGSMENLEQLWLAGNTNLGGSIPPELGQLTNLTHLVLNDCGLTGNLPKELAGQSNIYYWRIFNNDLIGCYPPELAVICSRLRPGFNGNDKISDGNDLEASWEDFCSNQSGMCEAGAKVAERYISGYNIYPNPTESGTALQLEFDSHTDSKDATLSIYNFNRQVVQSEDLTIQNGQNRFTTTLKNYAAGIYFVKLQSGTYTSTQKLVIQK